MPEWWWVIDQKVGQGTNPDNQRRQTLSKKVENATGFLFQKLLVSSKNRVYYYLDFRRIHTVEKDKNDAEIVYKKMLFPVYLN